MKNKVFLLDKPCGITSFKAIRQARKQLEIKKIGHCGTLDPFATGLLIVLSGRATRLSSFFMHLPKEYLAEVRFGQKTDSADIDGEIIQETEILPTVADLMDQHSSFLGDIWQTPPMYSAVKLQGKKLYEYARAGQTVERKARQVHIASLELLDLQGNRGVVRVRCSSGTYIRTLLEDWAEAAGSLAHLTQLRRLKIGEFSVDKAKVPDDVTWQAGLPLADALYFLPAFPIGESDWLKIKNGNPIARHGNPAEMVKILWGNEVVAIGNAQGSFYAPKPVLCVEDE